MEPHNPSPTAVPLARLAVPLALTFLVHPAQAQVTELLSVDSSGSQENYDPELPLAAKIVSLDGRVVAFISAANNLVPGDTNNTWDIFVRDRLLRTTERASISSSGIEGNGISGVYGMALSDDGRFVVFESASTNLDPAHPNPARSVFLRDRQAGTTELVALDSNGIPGNGASFYPAVSSDGHYVAFTSDSTNLVPGDVNGKCDTFVRDRWAGTTELVSVNFSGQQGNDDSYKPNISADGRYVAFESLASNLVGGDVPGSWDVFLRDRTLGTTRRASVTTAGIGSVGPSWTALLSDDGRFVAFKSADPNLVPGDTNNTEDVFVHDFQLGTTERVSLAWDGSEANAYSNALSVSGDGRYVLFGSPATNLVPGDSNANSDTFLRDRQQGTTERVSLALDGAEGNLGGGKGSMSSDGRYIAFWSSSTNLVAGDTNGFADVFLRDRRASGFTSLCDPGLNGVLACPCGNPASGAGRGCDNSSATGGAELTARGAAYLSLDSLQFAATDERPNATSVLLQGNTCNSNGFLFGQGVRCTAGSLKRLFSGIAVAGTVTLPAAGGSGVAARSGQLGDPIQPGESRYYLVYYRDPIVLGGCPSTSAFNCTQTGSVSWWP